VLPRTVRLQHSLEHVEQRRGAMAIPTLGPATDDDLEPTCHRLLRVTGARRHVNPRSHAGHPREIGRTRVALSDLTGRG
jgi:hypothetical protein